MSNIYNKKKATTVTKKRRANSIQKGKHGELELANLLKQYGYNTRRSQQYCGINGDADVVGIPNIHIECKRIETGHGSTYKWLEQAKQDCSNTTNMPIVVHRKNNKKWLVTLELSDFMDIITQVDKFKERTLDE